MLTGDRKRTAEDVAERLGIPEVYAELLPADKVDRVERLLASKSEKGRSRFRCGNRSGGRGNHDR